MCTRPCGSANGLKCGHASCPYSSRRNGRPAELGVHTSIANSSFVILFSLRQASIGLIMSASRSVSVNSDHKFANSRQQTMANATPQNSTLNPVTSSYVERAFAIAGPTRRSVPFPAGRSPPTSEPESDPAASQRQRALHAMLAAMLPRAGATAHPRRPIPRGTVQIADVASIDRTSAIWTVCLPMWTCLREYSSRVSLCSSE